MHRILKIFDNVYKILPSGSIFGGAYAKYIIGILCSSQHNILMT